MGTLIERVISHYITGTQGNHCPQGSLPTTSPMFYFKLPYIFFVNHSIKDLVSKNLSLVGSVPRMVSLHEQTVMPVT